MIALSSLFLLGDAGGMIETVVADFSAFLLLSSVEQFGLICKVFVQLEMHNSFEKKRD